MRQRLWAIRVLAEVRGRWVEAILCVWAGSFPDCHPFATRVCSSRISPPGIALNGETVADADTAPYIQQAIEQVEFVIGVPAMRAVRGPVLQLFKWV